MKIVLSIIACVLAFSAAQATEAVSMSDYPIGCDVSAYITDMPIGNDKNVYLTDMPIGFDKEICITNPKDLPDYFWEIIN